MIAKEIRARSDEELRTLLKSLADELFQYRMQNASGQPNAGRIRKTRRDFARVMTVMRERNLPPTAGKVEAAQAGDAEK